MEVTAQDILIVLNDIKEVIRNEWELEDNIYGNGLNGVDSGEYAETCVDAAIRIIENVDATIHIINNMKS